MAARATSTVWPEGGGHPRGRRRLHHDRRHHQPPRRGHLRLTHDRTVSPLSVVNGLGTCRQRRRQGPRPEQSKRSRLVHTIDSDGQDPSAPRRHTREEPIRHGLQGSSAHPGRRLVAAIVAAASCAAASARPRPRPPPRRRRDPAARRRARPPHSTPRRARTARTRSPPGASTTPRYTVVVIGDVVYVGGTLQPGRLTRRADGQPSRTSPPSASPTDSSQLRRQRRGPDHASRPRCGRSRPTARNLFVGGNFTLGQRHGRPAARQARPGHGRRSSPSTRGHPGRRLRSRLPAGNASVYAGGDFLAGASRPQGRQLRPQAPAPSPSWNANADARIESLKVSPSGQWVYIGGSFQAVQGQAARQAGRSSAAQRRGPAGRLRQQRPGVIGARVFDIAVDPSNEDNVFVALGPRADEPAAPDGRQPVRALQRHGWCDVGRQNGPDGDGQAVELHRRRSSTAASTAAGTATPRSASRV